MRRFSDAHGAAWDVVLGRESWGALYALFVPVGRDEPIRQALLQAVAHDAAQQELDQLDDVALRALLARSAVKEDHA